MQINSILSLLNEEVIKLDSKNGDLKTELTETKKRLFNALVKLDRIKLITKDKEILKILEELWDMMFQTKHLI